MNRSTLTIADIFTSVNDAISLGEEDLRRPEGRGRGEGLQVGHAPAQAEVFKIDDGPKSPLELRAARCEREAWAEAGRSPIFRDVPAWQSTDGGGFLSVRADDLLSVGLGVPVLVGARAFFAWDEEPIALRLRDGDARYVLEVQDGKARAWREPAHETSPRVLEWLRDDAPHWLRAEVRSRLVTQETAADATAVGLAVRFGDPPGRHTAAEILERVRRGLAPEIVTRARGWTATRSEAEWDELLGAATSAVARLRGRLDAFDPRAANAGELGLRLCRERDDLESLVAALRLARRASPVEPHLRALDDDAEDAVPALSDAITEPDPLLDAASVGYPSPWWARAVPRGPAS